MLIEFRVKNYRSIKDEQILSLVADKDKTLASTHLLSTDILAAPNLVKSCAIYGANASGKTNIIKAFLCMQRIVIESATKIALGQQLGIQPFKLNSKNIGLPSEFEITFICEGIRYQYGFSATNENIYEEWLLVYKTAKSQQWFYREKEKYTFSSHLSGQRKIWQESTRPNGLFLSTAVNLNSEQLKPIFNWITKQLICFPVDADLSSNINYSINMLQNNTHKKHIEKFMIDADISITNIQLDNKNKLTIDVQQDIFSPKFIHKTNNGTAVFELEDESHGTRQIFSLAGPLLDIIKYGKTLIFDELNNGLHPLLVRRILEIFNNDKININGAQLVFTTHDCSLLNQNIFRRDQIWFVKKNHYQESILYPQTDFSPRKNEALEKGYLSGRYGAVPFLDDVDL